MPIYSFVVGTMKMSNPYCWAVKYWNLIVVKCDWTLQSKKSLFVQMHLVTFTFSHLADAFIQSDLQLGST